MMLSPLNSPRRLSAFLETEPDWQPIVTEIFLQDSSSGWEDGDHSQRRWSVEDPKRNTVGTLGIYIDSRYPSVQ